MIFETVAKMKLAKLTVGQIISTKGYSVAGDGGGASYLVAASQTVDGYDDHELANGTVALLQNKSEFDTFANLQALRPSQTGQSFICQERANAKYILQASGYVALAGDVTFANGRVGQLQIDSNTNIDSFGTSADWDAAFDLLIARAQNDTFPIRLGQKTYTLTSQKEFDGSVPIEGVNPKRTKVAVTDFVGSLFKFNTTTTRNSTTGVSGITFTFNYSGAQTACQAIEFAGDNTSFLQYCDFEDLIFNGCESGFYGTQTPRVTSFGNEFNVNWCNFKNIKSRPNGYEVKYLYDFPNGSGTGNSFTDSKCKISSVGSIFYYTGVASVVGDLLIQGFSCSSDALGGTFITVGDDTEYRQNVCMVGNQLDANIETPFNLSQVGTDEYKDWKWLGNMGGLTKLNSAIGYSNGSIILDRGVSDFRVAKLREDLASGAQSVEICKVDVLQNKGGCTLNFEVFALVQGVGSGMHSSKYHIRNASGTASATLEVQYNTPTTPIMTITSTTSGSVITFFVDIAPTAAGSKVNADIQGIGKNFRLERI